MLHLQNKEYDLNTLFSFEVLKEILLKLARSQDKLENDIINIKQNFSKRDAIINKLEKSIFNTSSLPETNVNEGNEKNRIDSDEYKDKIKEKEYIKKEQFDTNKEKNNINTETEKKNEEDQNQKTPNKKDSTIDNNKITNKDNSSFDLSQSEKDPKSPRGALISPHLISRMMKLIKDQSAKINILDNKLKSESKNIKDIESQLKNHLLDNESQFKLVNDRIDSILQKNEDYETKLENLQVKTSEFDIFSMFKDSGDGSVDASKIMVKALEEKIFKKFELVDARYKKDSLDSLKMKTNVENITPKLDQFSRELERINEANKSQKEDLDNYKKENEEQNTDNYNNINTDINQRISELKDELENNMKRDLLLIQTQLNNMKKDSDENNNNTNNAFDLLKLSLGNNGLDSEAAQTLEKKINDLRKRIHDIENTLKLNMNLEEIDSLRKEIKDLKLLLEKKITKDDLKELYNFHLADVDELNDIKDRESITLDEIRKTIRDVQNIQQRIESINGNLSLLQNNPSNGNMKIIDFSKYIDNQKLTDTLKPFFKEFEKIFKEIDSFRRDIGEIENKIKASTKNSLSKIEEDITNKISEIKAYCKKRYIEKAEFHKTIKSIQIQIKSLGDESKRGDTDNWLLAKTPLKCFNCASCEANIKNENYNAADYLPWKKYPRGEKIQRMGQGFSHMLQMMTSEFIKSLEKTDLPPENEQTNRTNFNKSNYESNIINERKTYNGFIINNKEQIQEDKFQNLKKNSKMKLPKVKQYSKPKLKKFDEECPVSDEEYIEDPQEDKKETIYKNTSPRILKITKKNKIKAGDERGNKDLYNSLMTMPGGFSRDKNFGFGRNSKNEQREKNDFAGALTTSQKS